MQQMVLFEAGGTPAKDKTYRIQVVKVQMVRETSLSTYAKTLDNPAAAAELVRPLLEGADREHFLVICLDMKNRVNAIHTVSIGSLNCSVVHPREVFKAAILANAANVILVHNHPSGDPTPSKEDRAVTTGLVQAGRLLGIPVLDHVIIGEGRHFSFKQAGLI